MKMSDDNHEATHVLLKLLNVDFAYLVRLDHLGIYGRRIAAVYKSRFNSDLDLMVKEIDNAIGCLNIMRVHDVK